MSEIIVLGLILMVTGVLLPNLMPVGMVLCAAGLVVGVGSMAREVRPLMTWTP